VSLADARSGERPVWFDQGWRDTPIYDRARLPLDGQIQGPAILTQLDATTLIEPGDTASLDRLGNLVIEVRP
jgi:N-methylhydantoinase A